MPNNGDISRAAWRDWSQLARFIGFVGFFRRLTDMWHFCATLYCDDHTQRRSCHCSLVIFSKGGCAADTVQRNWWVFVYRQRVGGGKRGGEQVIKYNYIIVCPKAIWVGLVCRTHQHYHRQWLPNTEWSNSGRWVSAWTERLWKYSAFQFYSY